MANRKLGPSSGKCSKCGGRISINPPSPCRNCAGERLATRTVKKERTYTESEVRAAAMAEPELPDDMPDEMWEAYRSDRATMQEAMRVVVRLTRDGILSRLLDPV